MIKRFLIPIAVMVFLFLLGETKTIGFKSSKESHSLVVKYTDYPILDPWLVLESADGKWLIVERVQEAVSPEYVEAHITNESEIIIFTGKSDRVWQKQDNGEWTVRR